MEVGIKIGPALDRGVADLARRAEELGFDSVWLSERVATPLDKPHPYQPMVDPWIALAFVASVTERVKLGTSVSQIALRPPLLMARELATLDRLSGGRVIVGAGAGWVEEEFTSTGVPFETRGGRLNEVLRLLRHLWTKPEEPWNGKFFQIPAVGLVKPLTPGGPPLYLGAGAPAGVRRAARYGDGFISVMLPLETLVKIKAQLGELRSQYGRTGNFPFLTQVTPPVSVEDARSMVEKYRAAGVDGLIVSQPNDRAADVLAARAVAAAMLEAARSG